MKNPIDDATMARIAEHVRAGNLNRTAQALGVTRESLARVLAGQDVRRGTHHLIAYSAQSLPVPPPQR